MKICPKCQIEFEDKSVVCNRCGGELKEAAGAESKKTTRGFFDRCEEIEDRAICKKSGVKFYPER